LTSRKPQGKVERIPVDYPGSDPARHQMSPSNDFTGKGSELVIPALPPGVREERDAAAVRGLRRRGAEDLIDVLGLGVPEPRPVRVSATSVPCPQCKAPIGSPCVSEKTGHPFNGWHRGRSRRAQELREATA
jgi:hypothetical protein